MNSEEKCIICEADFRVEVMKEGKCPLCRELYPKAKSREDIKPHTKPKAETLTEKRVKDLIYEVFEEAGMVRKKCEKCGNLYFRTSPAMKYCSKCKESK